jgi:hypothetical protein
MARCSPAGRGVIPEHDQVPRTRYVCGKGPAQAWPGARPQAVGLYPSMTRCPAYQRGPAPAWPGARPQAVGLYPSMTRCVIFCMARCSPAGRGVIPEHDQVPLARNVCGKRVISEHGQMLARMVGRNEYQPTGANLQAISTSTRPNLYPAVICGSSIIYTPQSSAVFWYNLYPAVVCGSLV